MRYSGAALRGPPLPRPRPTILPANSYREMATVHSVIRHAVACAMLAAFAVAGSSIALAQSATQTVIVKFRDGLVANPAGALPDALAREVAAVFPGAVHAGATRDGGARFVLPAPLEVEAVRALLNDLRRSPAVLYAASERASRVLPDASGRPVVRLIVKYRDGALVDSARANVSPGRTRLDRVEALAGTAVAFERGTSRGEFLVRLVAPMDPARAASIAELIEQDPDVEYADADLWRYAMAAPNDPYYLDTSSNGQWHYRSPAVEPGGANLPGAWDITTGSPSIVVAVLDTGALFNHPDLSGRFLPGYDMIADVPTAADGDGRDPDPSDPGDWYSANVCGAGVPASPSSWHGSHVAGTIGANTNNGIGVAGIHWAAKILPVRVLGRCGGWDSDIQDAIVWASGGPVVGVPNNPTPARVINMSLGGSGSCSSATQSAINAAMTNGTVVVVSAGNSNNRASNYSPASCGGVITVGATQRQGFKAHYGNYGSAVEISAPGGGRNYPSNTSEGVWSTLNSGADVVVPGAGYNYVRYQGTSMAAPHISGVVSLMLSVNPGMTPSQVSSMLQSTARAFPTAGASTCNTATTRPPSSQWFSCRCTTSLCGAGIVDAQAAVSAAYLAANGVPGNATVTSNPFGTLSVTGATLVGNALSNFQSNAVLRLGSTPGNGSNALAIEFQGLSLAPANTLTIRSGAANQRVELINVSGNASTIAGRIVAEGANGAAPPVIVVRNASGVTVVTGGSIVGPSGLVVSALSSWTVGGTLVNGGTVDGGPRLEVQGYKINGGGAFKGDAVILSTPTFANNPVNGAHFLDNGLHVYPSTGAGTSVGLTLHAYGTAPQVLNVMIHGSGAVWMPSSWGAGVSTPANNAVIPPGGSRAPGVAEPGYGGGSMIVQATGALTVANALTNDFVFPGAIAFKAGGTLDLNGVVINQGWTVTGKQFQGVFFESSNIVSPAGLIQVLTNSPNWINFSTMPKQGVRTWSLTGDGGGGAAFVVADSFATHLNTYSATIEAAANGQCWTCLINTAPVDMY